MLLHQPRLSPRLPSSDSHKYTSRGAPAFAIRMRTRALLYFLIGAMVLLGPNGLLSTLPVHAAPQPAQANMTHPNLFDPRQGATSVLRGQTIYPADPNWQPPSPQPILHQPPPSMQPAAVPLHAGQAAHFVGSDGRLQVDLPASGVNAADVAQAGGALTLKITEIAPASGSNAGGIVSFDTYLLQVVDAHGKQTAQGLHAPVALSLHYGSRESALDLAHAFVVINGPLPKGVTLAPTASGATPALGARVAQATNLDASAHTLSATLMPGVLTASISWNTNSPVASFGRPDPFNVGINTGSLSAGYPIDLPAGPGGLTPPLTLSYSSAGVSENHSPQGAAPWVGEGWSLGLGSISWSEHNVTAGCQSCGATWQDSRQLSDPFGTAAELIPPNINVTTYYDDTPYSITASPIYWHSAPETHAKIISYVGPNGISGMTAVPPCFRVFLSNGIMEEFGCTPDSLQYYIEPSGANAGLAYVSNWLLDLVTDREGNQIHITYQSDTQTGAGGHTYARDTVLATIEYDSPGCHNVQAACTGASWAPLLRVTFAASHTRSA